MSTSARRREKEPSDFLPTSPDTTEFAKLLEASSLGSPEAQQARLIGSETLAEYPRTTPWAKNAPTWPDISKLDQDAMQAFAAENYRIAAELWLRAALLRTVDGPMSAQLAMMLESRHALPEAIKWYLRAAQHGHGAAAARLALLAASAEDSDAANLLLIISEQTMSPWQRTEARRILACNEPQARKRLLEQITDSDVLFWVACERLVNGDP